MDDEHNRPPGSPERTDTADTTPATPRQLPPMSRDEKTLVFIVVLAAVFVGALGLASSFQAVSAAALLWGFASPWMLPVGIDVAIPVFSCVHLFLIRFDMALAWVRAVPWALTFVTVYLNWSAGHSLPARLGHGALPMLWVVLSEVAAHVYRVLIGQATGKRIDRIRRSRWILAPLPTLQLWRRMVLWEVTSYTVALGLERERLLARADLRERYGRMWRWRAGRHERVLLRMGALAPSPLSAACERPITPSPDAQSSAAQELTSASGQDAPGAHGERAHGSVSSTDSDQVSASPKRPKRAKTRPAERMSDLRSGRVRALYDELGRRPEWTEIRDALTATGLSGKPISRPTAQRIRERVETEDPALAALGSPNVHPLTGTDS